MKILNHSFARSEECTDRSGGIISGRTSTKKDCPLKFVISNDSRFQIPECEYLSSKHAPLNKARICNKLESAFLHETELMFSHTIAPFKFIRTLKRTVSVEAVEN